MSQRDEMLRELQGQVAQAAQTQHSLLESLEQEEGKANRLQKQISDPPVPIDQPADEEQLKEECEDLREQLAAQQVLQDALGTVQVECAELRQQLEDKEQLQTQCEELKRDLSRVTVLTPGASEHAVTNVNYLKNIVVQYLCSEDVSSQRALLPVLGELLKLDQDELQKVKGAVGVKRSRSFFG